MARGAALASASAPRYDTTTIGLAYSQDPGDTVLHPLALADDTTMFLGHDDISPDTDDYTSDPDDVPKHSKPFLLMGSSLTAIFVAGVMALAIALVSNVRPTGDQGSGEMTVHPEAAAPSAPQQVPKTVPAPAPAAPPPAAIATARLKVPPAPPRRKWWCATPRPPRPPHGPHRPLHRPLLFCRGYRRRSSSGHQFCCHRPSSTRVRAAKEAVRAAATAAATEATAAVRAATSAASR